MVLKLHERVGMVVLSMTAPTRLARYFLMPRPQPLQEDLVTTGTAERIAFDSAGGKSCRGWWITPDEIRYPDQAVVLAHGWTSHALRLKNFVEPLLGLGYQVMLYHARSHGDSDPYPVCSMAQFTEDAHAAARFARERVASVAMLGHSMGAGASLVAAADGAPISAIVSIAAPAHPRRASVDLLDSQGVPGEMILRRTTVQLEQMIGRTFDSFAPELRLAEVRCPTLLIHGAQDDVVPVSHFEALRAAAGEHVETLLVDEADHDTIKTHSMVEATVPNFLVRNFRPSDELSSIV